MLKLTINFYGKKVVSCCKFLCHSFAPLLAETKCKIGKNSIGLKDASTNRFPFWEISFCMRYLLTYDLFIIIYFESEKIIHKIVGISGFCDQNGDRVFKSDKTCRTCNIRLKRTFS